MRITIVVELDGNGQVVAVNSGNNSEAETNTDPPVTVPLRIADILPGLPKEGGAR